MTGFLSQKMENFYESIHKTRNFNFSRYFFEAYIPDYQPEYKKNLIQGIEEIILFFYIIRIGSLTKEEKISSYLCFTNLNLRKSILFTKKIKFQEITRNSKLYSLNF